MEELTKLSDQRKSTIAQALNSVETLLELQQQLRTDYRKLLGSFPEKTPLNPVIIDTIEGDNYIIEKIIFESLPNHHVTANFYIPNIPSAGFGIFPAVVVLCGHYPVGKSIELYQDLCILFATNGIAALIVDPIAQGERYQVKHPKFPDKLAYVGGSGTTEATMLDVGSIMAGTSVTAWELWDNHRAVDYLYSRLDLVDTTRIGCTGSSGGGSQGTYLTAFDSRIKVSAINSFIMNEPALFSTIGPQTGSQNLSYEGLYGIDHPSYITMFAPKPFLILAATQDFFDITATRETYTEVKQIYEILGASEKTDCFEVNDSHGYSKPKREAAVKWFRTWFYGDTTSIIEHEHTKFIDDSLRVTEAGQVMYEFETEKNITDLNVELVNAYAADRQAFWANNTIDSCLNKVKELLMLKEYEIPVSEVVETLDRGDYTVDKIKISGDVPVTGLLFLPKNILGQVSAVLYVDGLGKKTDADVNGIIEKLYVDSSKIVLAIDVRGFGETADNSAKNESKHNNKEHRNAVISGYIGKTLVGQRVEDIQKALEVLLAVPQVNQDSISIVGIDRAASAVLHAAVLDTRFNKVIIRKNETKSLLEIVENPYESNNLTHVVPNILRFYDYPDLINAIAPRPVIYAEEPEFTAIEKTPVQGKLHFDLLNNYPNPFNPSTKITYVLDKSITVSLNIYNSVGQKVATLINNKAQEAGKFKLNWDGTDNNGNVVAAGVYLYRLQSPTKTITRKMLLIK